MNDKAFKLYHELSKEANDLFDDIDRVIDYPMGTEMRLKVVEGLTGIMVVLDAWRSEAARAAKKIWQRPLTL